MELNKAFKLLARDNILLKPYADLDFASSAFGENVEGCNANLARLLASLNNIDAFSKNFAKDLITEGYSNYYLRTMYLYLKEKFCAATDEPSLLPLHSFMAGICRPESADTVFDPIYNDVGLMSALSCYNHRGILTNFRAEGVNNCSMDGINMAISGCVESYIDIAGQYDNIVANIELENLEDYGFTADSDGLVKFIKHLEKDKWNQKGRIVISVPYSVVCANQEQREKFSSLLKLGSLDQVITFTPQEGQKDSKIVFLFCVNNNYPQVFSDVCCDYSYKAQEPGEFFNAGNSNRPSQSNQPLLTAI